MERAFAEAFLPVENEVLGYRLAPLCLAHLLLLEPLGNPLVCGGVVTIPHLLIFLKACANRPIRFGVRDRFLSIALRLRPALFREAVAACNAHVAASQHYPRERQRAEADDLPEGAELTAPSVLQRIAWFHLNSNLSHREILTLKLDQLTWLEWAICELKGGKVAFETSEAAERMRREFAELGIPIPDKGSAA